MSRSHELKGRNLRIFTRLNAPFLAVLLAIGPAAGHAQDRDTTTAEDVFENAREAYGPPPPEPKCDEGNGDEIVVCAEQQDQSQFRVKSSRELDPESEEALNDGVPRAPDVAGPGIFKGEPTIGGLCIPGLQKCPPAPPLFIDFSELPEAPEGSDADRISKGLAPRGNDTGIEARIPAHKASDTPIQPATPTESDARKASCEEFSLPMEAR